ncbi:rhomboid family intramembrane serine protease [Rubritalea spongiae]|uniref:Rhomboid family intramembrane serine protease n=1 Tax=Rubritalea spongiae TaxID=430797 RepID=A0ABW5E578_9BACT
MKTFCLLLILIHVVLSTCVQDVNAIYEVFGLSLDGIVNGKVWQFLSYGFLHGNWWHLAVNTMCIALLGLKLQQILDWKKALAVTMLAVLLGGGGYLLMNVFLPENQQGVLVGVSGGMMGLLLCLTTLDPDHRIWVTRIRSKHLGMGFLISSLCLALLTPALGVPVFSSIGEMLGNVFGEEMFYVSHACHFGGGIAGLFCGQYILRMIR